MGKPGRGGSRKTEPHLERAEFLQSVTDKARILTGGTAAALCVLDAPREQIRLVAASGEFADHVGDETSAGEGLNRHLLMASQPLVCTTCDAECCPFMPSPARHYHLLAPVRVDGDIGGVLCSVSASSVAVPRNPAPVLTHLARMAASGLASRRVWDLAEDLGAMAARQRVAADIHDGAAQKLIRLNMLLDEMLRRSPGVTSELPELVTARELVTSSIDDLRTMIASLRDPGDHACPPEELSEVLIDVAHSAGIPDGMVSVHGPRSCQIPHAAAVQVRLITAEALTNACRHADATAIGVRFGRDGREAVVRVSDNGHGYDTHGRAAYPGEQAGGAHVGTDIMQLRAATIGGRVEVCSGVDGTEVVLRWLLVASTTGKS